MTRLERPAPNPRSPPCSACSASGLLASRPSQGQDLSTPTPQPIGAAEMLRSEPFDRLTLIDNTVLIVEPVSPRPLPVIDTKKERERRSGAPANSTAAPIEIGAESQEGGGGSQGQGAGGARGPSRLHLLEGGRNEVRDFTVKRSSLKKVEYFEDMLIAEADRLTQAREFSRAFECCLRVRMRNPSWVGLDACVNRILFSEGRRALINGDDERGLRILRELLARNRDFPNLLDEIGQAYGKRIERAVRMNLFLQGRRVLHELEGVTGEIAAVRALRSLFTTRAPS